MPPKQRICPNCGRIMRKLPLPNQTDRPRKVWDLGITGPGITGTDTTSSSGSSYFGYSGFSGPSSPSEPIQVLLVPYECPSCHHKESFRDDT